MKNKNEENNRNLKNKTNLNITDEICDYFLFIDIFCGTKVIDGTKRVRIKVIDGVNGYFHGRF